MINIQMEQGRAHAGKKTSGQGPGRLEKRALTAEAEQKEKGKHSMDLVHHFEG